MDQACIRRAMTSSSFKSHVSHLIACTVVALMLSPVTATASVRQVTSARTPDAHCSKNVDGSVTCDSLPQSLTVSFTPTLSDSKLILLAQWNWVDNGQGPHGSMGGCIDNLGQ